MSKAFQLGVLAVLIVFIAVLSMNIRKSVRPEHDEEEQTQTTQNQKPNPTPAATPAPSPTPKPTGTPHNVAAGKKAPKAPGTMDISSDWFKKRAPGEAGIREIQAKSGASNTAPPTVPAPK